MSRLLIYSSCITVAVIVGGVALHADSAREKEELDLRHREQRFRSSAVDEADLIAKRFEGELLDQLETVDLAWARRRAGCRFAPPPRPTHLGLNTKVRRPTRVLATLPHSARLAFLP